MAPSQIHTLCSIKVWFNLQNQINKSSKEIQTLILIKVQQMSVSIYFNTCKSCFFLFYYKKFKLKCRITVGEQILFYPDPAISMLVYPHIQLTFTLDSQIILSKT
jgi:hypothetical protein